LFNTQHFHEEGSLQERYLVVFAEAVQN
jgi:hypothetical protein